MSARPVAGVSRLPGRVLVTGAAGTMGTSLRGTLLRRIARVRLSDIRPVGPTEPHEEFVHADLTDLGQVRAVVRGTDAVIHLGGIPDETGFDALKGPNLEGVYNVFEACRLEQVPRVVNTSSNRITGFHPVDRTLDGLEAVRPDGLYGAAKAFGEALASLYADRFGLDVVSVRIGSFEERPSEPRHLHTWLSPSDAARLYEACLAAPAGIGHVTIYGVSRNTRSWWSQNAAASALGYEPRDDAEEFADRLQPYSEPCQGGRYTHYEYGGWAARPDAHRTP
ncbi:NAD-dependent epimerase/dehydratase family protein [Streptosporangium carneum]|uniref:TDP-glucose-4,6-dehydratase n=1 Tax=Streptosporangium carneum TaxID=47481 RepID=A0A9W6MFZ8_9ACTN|nr:NAD(P)-dependent oxidoreductase [Streptosporangium carneum]GLK12580.1 TDP-glucose-4,6-dehydratase [Streptosporangium carneum]